MLFRSGFNFSSAVGRLACGFMSDRFGPLNTLLISLLLSSVSMLVLWPVSTTLGPLIAFVIINGTGNGGFFSTIPTVVGSVFGSARVSVAMGMMVTGWAGGYLMVSEIPMAVTASKLTETGGADCRISPCCVWWRAQHAKGVPPSDLLCRLYGVWCFDFGGYSAA